MSVHPNFADWYRSAAVTVPEGHLEKRWAGIEAVAKDAKPELVVGLVTLFSVPNATESSIPTGFRESFKAHDEGFPAKDNLQEMRVLAGATARCIVDRGDEASILAALALSCGAFGTRTAISLEREHTAVSEKFLLQYSNIVRQCSSAPAIKTAGMTKAKFTELLNPTFSQNQLPQSVDPLATILSNIGSGLVQAQKAIDELTHTIRVREEEINVLWWLQTQFSRDLNKAFNDVGYAAGILVFPKELADLTVFIPGSPSSTGILLRALQLAGLPSSSDAVSIADATNSTPRQWRETLKAEQTLGALSPLCPVLFAVHKSLETDGALDWLPVYKKACDVTVDQPYPVLQLTNQAFREQMLVRALRDAS